MKRELLQAALDDAFKSSFASEFQSFFINMSARSTTAAARPTFNRGLTTLLSSYDQAQAEINTRADQSA